MEVTVDAAVVGFEPNKETVMTLVVSGLLSVVLTLSEAVDDVVTSLALELVSATLVGCPKILVLEEFGGTPNIPGDVAESAAGLAMLPKKPPAVLVAVNDPKTD